MNLSDLEVFKAVVEEGGVIRAARRLHRVPSNVTTRIKQLEAAIGVNLFHRDRQRLHLSPTGELLLHYADRLIQLSEEARVAVSGTAPRGVFKLGALESTTASRLPEVLGTFHRRYPDVRLELTTGTNDQLAEAVVERRLDAAFIAERPVNPALAFEPVFAERLMVISGAEQGPIRRARDTRGLSLIAFPEGCAYRRVLQRWLGRAGSTTSRILEFSSYHAIIACVASGTGVALMPESVLDVMPLARVRRNPIAKAYANIVTPLIWRSGEATAPVAALRDVLVALCKSGVTDQRPR